MDEIKIIKNAIRRIESKWKWLIDNHPKTAQEVEDSCRPGRPRKEVTIGRDAVSAYCEAYKARYSSSPQITGFGAGRLKKVAEEIGIESTKKFLLAYLEMNDQWFLKRSHDIDTFAKNLNKIKLYSERGVQVTAEEAKTAEKLSKNAQIMGELMNG